MIIAIVRQALSPAVRNPVLPGLTSLLARRFAIKDLKRSSTKLASLRSREFHACYHLSTDAYGAVSAATTRSLPFVNSTVGKYGLGTCFKTKLTR
jgi:hypothetical protein